VQQEQYWKAADQVGEASFLMLEDDDVAMSLSLPLVRCVSVCCAWRDTMVDGADAITVSVNDA
jgi:hypothetical protein